MLLTGHGTLPNGSSATSCPPQITSNADSWLFFNLNSTITNTPFPLSTPRIATVDERDNLIESARNFTDFVILKLCFIRKLWSFRRYTYGEGSNTLTVCFETWQEYFMFKTTVWLMCSSMRVLFTPPQLFWQPKSFCELFGTIFFRVASLLLRRVPSRWYEKLFLNYMRRTKNLKARATYHCLICYVRSIRKKVSVPVDQSAFRQHKGRCEFRTNSLTVLSA